MSLLKARKHIILPILPLIILLIVFFLFKTELTYSETAKHVVISEIQIEGSAANDEYIELYNPTDSQVDISGWSIQRETISGSFDKKNFEGGDSIPTHGFFLIANADFTTIPVAPDMTHSSFELSGTGTTVFLVNDQNKLTTGDEITIVDKVAIGESSLDPETTPFTPIPTAGQSIERKPGESIPNAGNGEDTNDNSQDFSLRQTSQPQNTSSATEVPSLPTQPITSTVTPPSTPTPTPTESPTPTPTESPTPTPTESLTPTPAESLTPTPTESLTPTPTEEITPTPTLTPSPTPSVIPTPTTFSKLIGVFNFPGKITTCSLVFIPVRFGFFTLLFPYINCV